MRLYFFYFASKSMLVCTRTHIFRLHPLFRLNNTCDMPWNVLTQNTVVMIVTHCDIGDFYKWINVLFGFESWCWWQAFIQYLKTTLAVVLQKRRRWKWLVWGTYCRKKTTTLHKWLLLLLVKKTKIVKSITNVTLTVNETCN